MSILNEKNYEIKPNGDLEVENEEWIVKRIELMRNKKRPLLHTKKFQENYCAAREITKQHTKMCITDDKTYEKIKISKKTVKMTKKSVHKTTQNKICYKRLLAR